MINADLEAAYPSTENGYISSFFGHGRNIFRARMAHPLPLEKLARTPMIVNESHSSQSDVNWYFVTLHAVTTPHPPYNLSVVTSRTTARLSWLPAYDGGFPQHYVVW